METPVTEPMAISTSDGGIVSAIAPAPASSDTISPSSRPRLRISGDSTGATAAMSAVFAPEMPDTSSMAPSSTYCSPPRTCPSIEARNATILRHLGDLNQPPQHDEQGHREQDERAHALVDPPGQDCER